MLHECGALNGGLRQHNRQQAARVADDTPSSTSRAGRVRADRDLFTSPADRRTEDYITGR
jgi:ABC-type phosphate transport system ATPase subunit